ncbi:MAG: Gfo/Idh/MocA family oxidoreductase [Bacteroidales bacterium]|nr:Gfo/Idh/MocA family oxidoreductase [Bacteroidales bacterium]
MKNNKTNRRDFIAKTTIAATGLSLGLNTISANENHTPGASDKIRVGFIGVGNRGTQLLRLFMAQPDCEVAALCDLYEPYMLRDYSKVDKRYTEGALGKGGQIPKMGEKFPNNVTRYNDYRKLLEDKTIDAVCIATPDHWHAIQTIDAIKAGKDVYVEKPLTATIHEGRSMVNAQIAGKRVVAVGLNRRGNQVYQKLAGIMHSGKLGKLTVGRAAHINNMFPNGIGKLSPESPPKDFNWDMWLGPRPFIPYKYNIAPYTFRWWSDYSSQMGNWGVHYMDVIRWMMGEMAPVAISAHGGKYVLDDDSTIPDTLQVTFEFASGSMIMFSDYEASSGSMVPFGEIEIRGTKGTVLAHEGAYKIVPSTRGQFQTWDKLIEPEEYENVNRALDDGSSAESTSALIRNFLDCIRSRETPLCSLEEGHRSTSFAHLANIALATKTRLLWDAEKEKFTNSVDANNLLHYEYRKPWKLG